MPLLPEIRIVFSLSCCFDSTGVRRVSQASVARHPLRGISMNETGRRDNNGLKLPRPDRLSVVKRLRAASVFFAQCENATNHAHRAC
jgi:hypothetical protein